MRNLHPLRLQYEAFSSQNPFMAVVKSLAERASEDRKQVSTDNPFVAFQEQFSKQIVNALDSWRDAQEALSEATFLAVYGSPALQAAVGIDPQSAPSRRQEMSAAHREMLQKRIAELKSKISEGGLREAAIRGLLYVGSARGMVDERSLEALRNVRRKRLRCAADAGRVQDAGPRAILHASAGSGGSTGRDTEAVARQCKGTRGGFRGDSRSAVRQRRNIG
jgi:hypothetical protein